MIPVFLESKDRRLTCQRVGLDSVVVGSIAANEAVIAVLQSSVLDKLGVILLKMSIVLIQAARAMNTTGRTNVRRGSVMGASGVHDALVLLRGAVTAVAVEVTVLVTAVGSVIEDKILSVDVLCCLWVPASGA